MFFEKAENDGKENLDNIINKTEEKYRVDSTFLDKSNDFSYNKGEFNKYDNGITHKERYYDNDKNAILSAKSNEKKDKSCDEKNENSNKINNGFDIKNLEKTIANVKKIKRAMQGNPLALIELMNPNEKMKDAVKVMKLLPAVLSAMGNDSDYNDNFFRNNDKNDTHILNNSYINEQKITFDLRENKSKSANFTINQNYSNTSKNHENYQTTNHNKKYDFDKNKTNTTNTNYDYYNANNINLKTPHENNDKVNFDITHSNGNNFKADDSKENYNLNDLLSNFQKDEKTTLNPLLSAINNQFFASNYPNGQNDQSFNNENLAKFLDKS